MDSASAGGGYGGAIHYRNAAIGPLKITGSLFYQNHADGWGGAIQHTGNASKEITVKGGVFEANKAAHNGGAIGNSGGTLNIDSSTFEGNIATQGSGGAVDHFKGVSTISNSTFFANEGSRTSAIQISNTSVTIESCTITGNIGSFTDLLSVAVGGAAVISNSIISGNTGAGDGGKGNVDWHSGHGFESEHAG